MATDYKAMATRILEEAWNQGNVAVYDELVAPNCIIHDPARPDAGRGPQEFTRFTTAVRQAFPDIRFKMEDLLVRGSKVVLRWSARGTHQGEFFGAAPTNKECHVSGMMMQRYSKGQIVETWSNWDALGLMRQIGAVRELEYARR